MIDKTELKRLAEAFPEDLDLDSNTEPFFNGPSGESLGGGPTGFYCVYGPAFEIDGEQYDGPTYVESCKADFAKFMVAARQGVLDLIAENQRLSTNGLGVKLEVFEIVCAERDELKADNESLRAGMKGDYDLDAWLDWTREAESLRKDAERYRWIRKPGVNLMPLIDSMGEDMDKGIDDDIAKAKGDSYE